MAGELPLPPPPAPNVQPVDAYADDALGRRIGAAVIDILLLTALGAVLALTIGEKTTTSNGWSIRLEGGGFLLYLALLLLYYFVLEAATGKTVGKLAFGVVVRHVNGRPASAGAIAIRTLLRLIDWLPFLYLAGFVTMLATGRRRQRLGDLAAKTVVIRSA
jgi:uncharacterized RDD family membrane protein YckC